MLLTLQIRKLQTQFVNDCHQFQHVSRHQAMPKKNFPPKVGDGRFEVQDKLGEACSSFASVALVEGWPTDRKSVDGGLQRLEMLADFADSVILAARSYLIDLDCMVDKGHTAF